MIYLPKAHISTISGMYCVLLVVADNAGNYVHVRRFILFDDYTNLTISTINDMWVDSAVSNTSYTWVTDLDSNVSSIYG